jgi:hypothetical protein
MRSLADAVGLIQSFCLQLILFCPLLLVGRLLVGGTRLSMGPARICSLSGMLREIRLYNNHSCFA